MLVTWCVAARTCALGLCDLRELCVLVWDCDCDSQGSLEIGDLGVGAL